MSTPTATPRTNCVIEMPPVNPPRTTPTATPRTDAAWGLTLTSSEFSATNAAQQMRDKCAELETELARLRADNAHLNEVVVSPVELVRLRAEVERLKTCGITELAAVNPSVADYCKHWEARAERAEAERDALAKDKARLDWLKSNVEEIYSNDWGGIVYLSGDNIRDAIDAAMKGTTPPSTPR